MVTIDIDETWSVGIVTGAFDVQNVITHFFNRPLARQGRLCARKQTLRASCFPLVFSPSLH